MIKNLSVLLITITLGIFLSSSAFGSPNQPADSGRKLIVYYSLSGNTKTIAGYIQEFIGGDMVEIITVDPYPDEFESVVRQARRERQENYLPPIEPIAVDTADYQTIYLGFPIWGNTIPQPLATFLSQNNLAGKTIVPFCTHDDFGLGHSRQDISEYCPEAALLESFEMVGANAKRAGKDLVYQWLTKLDQLPTDQTNAPKMAQARNPIPIAIFVNDIELTGYLNDSHESREFIKMLPKTVPMVGYGGREYYGTIPERIEAKREGQLSFENGDITYCPQNNSIAIFYAQTDRPNLTMKVMPIGKVISDLSIFDKLESSVNVRFELQN